MHPVSDATMGTAIIAIHTQQGFVICADGRRSKHTGEVISETEQKIFPVECESGVLAYGHFGITTLHEEPSGNLVHDLRVLVRHAFAPASTSSGEEFGSFIHKVAQNIYTRLTLLKESDPEVTFHQETVMQFIVGGYWHGRRALARLTFTHSDQVLSTPTLKAYEPRKTRWEPALSEEVFCSVLEGKEGFSRYRIAAIAKMAYGENLSLYEAIAAARSLIKACYDPAAREADKNCFHVGGHIHMATITPDVGFQWVIEPVRQQSQ